MFDKASVLERVKRVTVEQLSVLPEEVVLQASFRDELGADSQDTVELLMGIESEFDIEITGDDAEKLLTVADVVDYIIQRG